MSYDAMLWTFLHKIIRQGKGRMFGSVYEYWDVNIGGLASCIYSWRFEAGKRTGGGK